MKLILFSKMLQDKNVKELITLAHELGLDGYDLAVRPGHPVHPENAATALVDAARLFQMEGLSIPLITSPTDLVLPDHPAVEPMLSAMDAADVRMIKPGYFKFDPAEQDYWQEVDRAKIALEGWAALAKKYNVKICYHNHSRRCMGLNAATMAHLIQGFDPSLIGAYLDPGHLAVEGEEFAVGAAIVRKWLSIVGLKDVLLTRADKNGHGTASKAWIGAGTGVVDWTDVFSELTRIGFDGPLSVHNELKVPEDELMPAMKRDVTFFKRFRDQAVAS